MNISAVSVHDPDADQVKLIKLERSYCLSVGPIDVFGSLAELREIVGRAGDLIKRATP